MEPHSKAKTPGTTIAQINDTHMEALANKPFHSCNGLDQATWKSNVYEEKGVRGKEKQMKSIVR